MVVENKSNGEKVVSYQIEEQKRAKQMNDGGVPPLKMVTGRRDVDSVLDSMYGQV